MAQALVTADVHQALDIHIYLAPQTALNLVFRLDYVAQLRQLIVRESANAFARIHLGLRQDMPCGRPPNAVDICQPDLNALVSG
jgi:hypothetical protein